MKRWISRILACLMLLVMMPTVAHAAGGPALTFSLTAEGDTSVGSILTITFSIIRTDSSRGYRLNAMQNEIEYDKDCFELIPDSLKLLRSGSAVARTDQRTDGTRIIAVNDMLADYNATETICTFQLKVIGTDGSVRSSHTQAFSNDAENPRANLVTDASERIVVGSGVNPKDTITVTMRLIGAELADEDVNLGTTEYMPDYVTWIPTSTYTLKKGSTVYDLWVMATEEWGIRSEGAEQDYVKVVYAPDGYALCEMTNGRRSGWMYTVNSSHPNIGLTYKELSDGDSVVWHYVNDYAYEVSDWSQLGGGQWSPQGDGSYCNRWLMAPDFVGGKGGGLPEDSEADNTDNGAERTGVVIYVPVKDDSSIITVPDDEFTKAVEEAVKTGENQIIIVVTGTGENVDAAVEINPMSVRQAAQNGIGLRVELPLGTVWIEGSDVRNVFYNAWNAVSFTIHRGTGNSVVVQIYEGMNPISADGVFHSSILAAAFGRTVVNTGDVVYQVREDGSETLVRKSLVENGRIYTLLDGSAILRLRFNAKEFDDVKPENWFAEAVDFVSGHELFLGISKTEFAPKMTMTRAMLVTVLYRLEDEPAVRGVQKFSDVEAGTWYTDAVEWASDDSIVKGVGKDRYAPNDEVTREQIATMLFRYAQYLGMDVSGRASLDKFYDSDQVSSWAKDAMEWAVKLGIFQGDDTGALNPKNNATRAEVATLMQRIVAMIVK